MSQTTFPASLESGVHGRVEEVARRGGGCFPGPRCTERPPLCDVPGSSTHPFQPQPGRVQQSTFQRFRFLVCQPVEVLVRCCLRRHAASASIFSFVGLLTAMPGCRMLVRGIPGTGRVVQPRGVGRQRQGKGIVCEVQKERKEEAEMGNERNKWETRGGKGTLGQVKDRSRGTRVLGLVPVPAPYLIHTATQPNPTGATPATRLSFFCVFSGFCGTFTCHAQSDRPASSFCLCVLSGVYWLHCFILT